MSIVSLVALFGVLFIAATFACLETATVAVSEHRLISLAKTNSWARHALYLKRELDKILIFSLFGNNLFNAALTTLSTMLVLDVVKESGHWLLTVVTLLVTLIIIIFSEATPKIIASKASLQVLRWLAIPMYYTFIVCRPIIWLIDKIVYGFTQLLGIGAADGTSLDDLRAIISDKRIPFIDQHRMIMKNSIEFEQLLVKDVVIPLRQVEMIDINADHQQNLKKISRANHSKMIVYANNVDNIIGYIKVRELLGKYGTITPSGLKKIIRPLSFIQDFLPVIKQLSYLQKLKQNLFVVVNEYGNILGIASATDMVELVFGDFTTDVADKKDLVIRKSEYEFIVDGAMLIREFNELYQQNLPVEFDALTVNGLIVKFLRMIPSHGTCFKINNAVFEILQAGDFGVERVRLIMKPAVV